MNEKERTLRGVHQGQRLYLGHDQGEARYATVWDGLLLLKRNARPHPLIREWRGRLIVGGRFWYVMPHAFGKNPLTFILYPDSLLNTLTQPVRQHLLPGGEWKGRLDRRLAKWLQGRFKL